MSLTLTNLFVAILGSRLPCGLSRVYLQPTGNSLTSTQTYLLLILSGSRRFSIDNGGLEDLRTDLSLVNLRLFVFNWEYN